MGRDGRSPSNPLTDPARDCLPPEAISDANGSFKHAKFKVVVLRISLVALGPSTLRLQDANGKPTVVKAQRVVYVAATDRLLIDGKPWRFKGEREIAERLR